MPADSQKRISWLKFEPKVSNFPVTKTAIAVLVTYAIMTIFCFSIYFLKEEQRTLTDSQKRISWYYANFSFSISHKYDNKIGKWF